MSVSRGQKREKAAVLIMGKESDRSSVEIKTHIWGRRCDSVVVCLPSICKGPGSITCTSKAKPNKTENQEDHHNQKKKNQTKKLHIYLSLTIGLAPVFKGLKCNCKSPLGSWCLRE